MNRYNGWPYIIKTNSVGDTSWTKTYDDYIYCQYVLAINNGYVFPATGNHGEGLLIATDNLGDTLWSNVLLPGWEYEDYSFQSMTITFNNCYILATNHYFSAPWPGIGNTDGLIVMADVNGDTIWTRCLCSSGGINSSAGINSVIQTCDSGYIASGIYQHNIFISKVAPSVTALKQSDNNVTQSFALSQNYPNPFNPSTTIEFDLPKTSEVNLKIFNILGEEVTTLVSDRLSAGSYSYEWDASKLASGVYLYRLQAGNYVETRKMVLMK